VAPAHGALGQLDRRRKRVPGHHPVDSGARQSRHLQDGGQAQEPLDGLRTLLIQAAKSAVLTVHRRSDRISRWLCTLRERTGWQIAAVALANKNARILWALMTKGDAFDANHLSVKPGMSPQPT
jgi:hypothetical protein